MPPLFSHCSCETGPWMCVQILILSSCMLRKKAHIFWLNECNTLIYYLLAFCRWGICHVWHSPLQLAKGQFCSGALLQWRSFMTEPATNPLPPPQDYFFNNRKQSAIVFHQRLTSVPARCHSVSVLPASQSASALQSVTGWRERIKAMCRLPRLLIVLQGGDMTLGLALLISQSDSRWTGAYHHYRAIWCTCPILSGSYMTRSSLKKRKEGASFAHSFLGLYGIQGVFVARNEVRFRFSELSQLSLAIKSQMTLCDSLLPCHSWLGDDRWPSGFPERLRLHLSKRPWLRIHGLFSQSKKKKNYKCCIHVDNTSEASWVLGGNLITDQKLENTPILPIFYLKLCTLLLHCILKWKHGTN